MSTRIERDSMGEIEVPADRYWGAQTQRSLENFKIGKERLPRPLIRALGLVKQCAAAVNQELGDLPGDVSEAIREAAQEVIDGRLDEHFPLVVWQTGSGTQSNMNANEVIANRAAERMGDALGANRSVHPNDHVNRSQSTNDVFPSAIHVAVAMEISERLLPALVQLRATLAAKARAFDDIVKIGRTHLQDATPLTLGQEFSGYADQLRISEDAIGAVLPLVLELPIGGTAVGTGLNTRAGYARKMTEAIAERTALAFIEAPNRFASMAGKEGPGGSLGRAQDRGRGPEQDRQRCALARERTALRHRRDPHSRQRAGLLHHAGKVNPTQSEALTMVATRVIGNDVTVTVAGGSGNFELNVYLPVIGYTVLQSVDLLAAAADSFNEHCVAGIEANLDRIEENLHRSLMLVTALNPHIGYDRAADVAKTAYAQGKTLREVVVERGLMSAERFDEVVVPARMIRPGD